MTYFYVNFLYFSPATAAFAAAGGAMNLFMGRCRGGRILGVDVLAPWGMSIPKSEAFWLLQLLFGSLPVNPSESRKRSH